MSVPHARETSTPRRTSARLGQSLYQPTFDPYSARSVPNPYEQPSYTPMSMPGYPYHPQSTAMQAAQFGSGPYDHYRAASAAGHLSVAMRSAPSPLMRTSSSSMRSMSQVPQPVYPMQRTGARSMYSHPGIYGSSEY